MSKNRITGGEDFWVLLVGFIALVTYPKVFFILLIIGAIIFIIVLFNEYSNMPVCQGCGKKSGLAHLHRRVDGGPDRRYHHNPLVCPYCKTDPQSTQTNNSKGIISCHYVNLPGIRRFEDCKDYPKNLGEQCKKCWVKNK